MNDNVNHPKHYAGAKGIEVIDVMENFIPPLDGMKAICMGNIVKYVLRHHHKNGVEDLMKARWYLDRLISYYDESEKEDTIEQESTMLVFKAILEDGVNAR